MLDISATQRAAREAAQWLIQQDLGLAARDWLSFVRRAELTPAPADGRATAYSIPGGHRLNVQLQAGALFLASVMLFDSEDMYGWEEEAYEDALDQYESAFCTVVAGAESVLGKADHVGDPEADGFQCDSGAMRSAVWRRGDLTVELTMDALDDQGPVDISLLVWPAAVNSTRGDP